MKSIRVLVSLFVAVFMVSFSGYSQYVSPKDSLGGAPVPSEREDPELLAINKEPAHANLMPYANLNEALIAKRHSSTFCRRLNGMWKFNWVSWPQMRPVDFYKPTFNVTSWKEISVPSNWQVLGYGTPYYRNMGYIIRKDFPHVMSMPPKNFTAYEERNPVSLIQTDKEITVKGSGFAVVFDKTEGTFSSLEKNGVNMLLKDGGPRLHLWRAPHRNDDMWADKGWVTSGLRELKWTTQSVNVEQKSPSSVTITITLLGEGKNNFTVNHNVVYTISGDGSVKSENTFSSSDPKLAVARIGVRIFLDKKFDQASYFGRGPMENYADRKRGFDIGVYKSTVKEQLTHYEKPMDCGNHEDVRWAKVTTASGNGLMAQSGNTLMQVSMLPYSDEVMDKVEYRIDLPQSNATVFCISHLTLGVGTAGCGPRPLPGYIVYAEPTSFTYILKLL